MKAMYLQVSKFEEANNSSRLTSESASEHKQLRSTLQNEERPQKVTNPK